MRHGRGQRNAAFALILTLALAQPAGASTLERVLRAIDALGASPLTGLFANVAANGGPEAARGLRPGDQVIVGYDGLGAVVTAQAGPEGLWVDPTLAGTLHQGLAAGLYPPGSALYALPPAGQLSLYDADREGQALNRAREFLAARIDGSIATVMTGLTLPDLALVRVGPALPAFGQAVPGRIATTVLGAVNTGQVITSLIVEVVPQDPAGAVFPALAGIAAGANQSVHRASAAGGQALTAQIRQLGGAPGAAVAMLNLAANHAEVLGRVETRVAGQGARLGAMVTTVLGAVNGGAIGPGGP